MMDFCGEEPGTEPGKIQLGLFCARLKPEYCRDCTVFWGFGHSKEVQKSILVFESFLMLIMLGLQPLDQRNCF